MANPAITYDPGSGLVTLNFSFPPVSKPGADDRNAVRNDSITCSGLKQSMWQRTDIFKTLQMDFVPMDDLVAWEAFLDYALQGGEFNYYPGGTSASVATIYSITIDSNGLLTAVTGFNSFSPGDLVEFAGLTAAKFLNGQLLPLASAGTLLLTAQTSFAAYGTTADTGTASTGAFGTYTLEDVNWSPKYSFRSMAKFTLKLRQVYFS